MTQFSPLLDIQEHNRTRTGEEFRRMSDMKKLHILVMSSSWQAALACIQSYGRRGHTVSILPTPAYSPNDSSVYVKNKCTLPGTRIDEWAGELLRLVERMGIDLVIPISDVDAAIVATAKQLTQNGKAFIVSSPDAIAVTRSRNRTVELCKTLGIDTPKTLFVTHETAAEAARNLGYPCFLKLSGSVASYGVFRISGEAELAKRLETIPRHAEMQIQEMIDSDVFGVTGFALDGNVQETFAFRRENIEIRPGTAGYITRVADARLDDMLSKIAIGLRWSGGIDLDLLQRSDGTYLLMEINPRFSGTTVFPLKLGIDLPMYYAHALTGTDTRPRFECKKPNAERFIILLEETRYLRSAGAVGRKHSLQFRAENNWIDNSFWDDTGYSSALFEITRRWLLYAKK